jgi:hypothetical protein
LNKNLLILFLFFSFSGLFLTSFFDDDSRAVPEKVMILTTSVDTQFPPPSDPADVHVITYVTKENTFQNELFLKIYPVNLLLNASFYFGAVRNLPVKVIGDINLIICVLRI